MIDGVRIKLTQVIRFRVCIRERLKIDDEFLRVESFPNVFDGFTNLIANRVCFYGRRRPKRVVVAIGASACRDRAVAIWTCETCIYDDFVDALPKFFLKPAVIRTEAWGWR